MDKEYLVKSSHPTLLKVGYTIAFTVSVALMLLPEPYNQWFVLVLVPWLFYVINDSKAKKLQLGDNSIVIGKWQFKHEEIVKIAVHHEKIELVCDTENKLMRLIIIVAKDNRQQNEINERVERWKVQRKRA
jgi:hypothetical protein